MAQTKETKELINFIADVIRQGVESFADGVQLGKDLPEFIDELIEAPKAFQGVGKAFGPEADTANPESVDELFIDAELTLYQQVNPLVAKGAVSLGKAIYCFYAAGRQSKK